MRSPGASSSWNRRRPTSSSRWYPVQASRVWFTRAIVPSSKVERYPQGAFSYRSSTSSSSSAASAGLAAPSGSGEDTVTLQERSDRGDRLFGRAQVRAVSRRRHEHELAPGDLPVDELAHGLRGDHVGGALEDERRHADAREIGTVVGQ